MDHDFDFIVIGSGFGGSVSAHRLTEKGYRVAVIEMGRRFTPQNMPATNWDMKRWIWRPKLGLHGFFNMRFFRHVTILHGCAVGGGSITYANTMLVPPQKVWQMGSWAPLSNWSAEMPAHYATAKKMLGVIENRILGPSDYILQKAADAAGVGHTFYRTQVAVFEAGEGEVGGQTRPDPYFGGDGPARATCIGCGGCMIGCQHNAKNSLDKNYLYLAEKHGAKVFDETRVIDVRPLGDGDGDGGYEVFTEGSLQGAATHNRRFTAGAVVFAASALGTMELLFQLKDKKSLPRLSDAVGKRVRTNAESLVGIRVPGTSEDLSKGIAIGSGVYIDEHTHIEAVRYPKGSDSLGFLCTMMTGGTPGVSRIFLWLWTLLLSLVRRPLATLRALRPFGWAKESVIFLCMQALDGHIDMRWQRPWFWPFAKMLRSAGQRIPTYIPKANEFALQAAKLTGGVAMSMSTEILFNVPGTAHILGGCTMAETAADGVVDAQHRVFGYRNLYICDGSVVSANLGVNPSLTICALTERAMSFIPNRARTQ